MNKTKHIIVILLSVFLFSCGNDSNHSSGNDAVMEGSNKDDQYQRSGYGDSIPSDSVKEQVRLDSSRIANSPNHNK